MATTKQPSAEEVAGIINAYIAAKGYEEFVSAVVYNGHLHLSGMNMVLQDIARHLRESKIEFTATEPGACTIAAPLAKPSDK
jgi:hypothetical protein